MERLTQTPVTSAPFFSVLIATYNHAHYIREALDSVRAQTFSDWEIIVVDDGSTDETPTVLNKWLEDLDERDRARVTTLRQANAGQSAAFESGYERCKGRYIALLDSDDRWLPERLEVVAREASAHGDAGMLFHPMWIIDAEGRRTGASWPRAAKQRTGDLREEIRRNASPVAAPGGGSVFRTDVFSKLVPMPTKHIRSAADAYLTFGATLLAPVHAIPTKLAEYRIHSDGNYIRRMLSPEGMAKQLELQRAITSHFGLEHVAHRNSYYARNSFAVARMSGSRNAQVTAYHQLVSALAVDETFSIPMRLAFISFWSAGLIAPRSGFMRMWEWFHRRQAGSPTGR